MSLPAAPKDISDNPVPGSVIDPVNKAEKDADVDRKVRARVRQRRRCHVHVHFSDDSR
jgi:hypothetical protein